MHRLGRIQIEIPNQVIRQFKRQAKDAFPRETLAYLIGRDAGTVVEIESLFIPDGLDAHCTPASVVVQDHRDLKPGNTQRMTAAKSWGISTRTLTVSRKPEGEDRSAVSVKAITKREVTASTVSVPSLKRDPAACAPVSAYGSNYSSRYGD